MTSFNKSFLGSRGRAWPLPDSTMAVEISNENLKLSLDASGQRSMLWSCGLRSELFQIQNLVNSYVFIDMYYLRINMCL